MNLISDSIRIAAIIWLTTVLITVLGITLIVGYSDGALNIWEAFLISSICSSVGSLPACILLCFAVYFIRKKTISLRKKCWSYIALLGIIGLLYGYSCSLLLGGSDSRWEVLGAVAAALFIVAMLASFFQLRALLCFFSCNEFTLTPYAQLFKYIFPHYKPNHYMQQQQSTAPPGKQNNKILIKGLITGGLILLLLIPTIFIVALIEEREQRQKEIVKEVSTKWAAAQTVTGPFLVVPYTDSYLNSNGNSIPLKTSLIVVANDLAVKGELFPEERKRSIYKVLLYKTDLQISGTFKLAWPSDIDTSQLDLKHAKLCFALNDYKGIQEDMAIKLGNDTYKLSAGLPVDDFGKIGLSAPISLDDNLLGRGMPFTMFVRLKGSERLHFTALAVTSSFAIRSSWANPSFDGEMLPNERTTSDSGFTSQWKFNQANLPFAPVMKHGTVAQNKMPFGVSLVQPADQYSKTMRSVKYAILFIGLTFALFFIIESMQRNPLHPVQYVLVGLALVIFYALLLSLSEYITFNYAYALSALATVLLIVLYAHGHFKNIKTSLLLLILLAALYSFIFVLIGLEDTALLVGSIGLFIILALVMYSSRKINWYGTLTPVSSSTNIINE
jgi:inner membrane protein